MNIYQILGLFGIPTLSGLIVTLIFNHFTNGTKIAKQKRSSERKADLKELFDEFITPMSNQVTFIAKDLEKVSSGTLASLRNDLLESYYSCKKKGYRNNDDTKNFHRMLSAYQSLGGNDIIEHDVAPSFYNLKLLTHDEEIALQHNQLSKQDLMEKTLQKVIEQSANCPHYRKGE